MATIRNIDKLPATVPRETITRLKGFMGLQSHDEVQEWHEFCRNSPDKSVHGKPVKISTKNSHSRIALRLASTEGQQSMAFAIS
jgi:hypothetical protein